MNTILQSPLPNFLDAKSKEYDHSKIFTDGRFYIYNKELAYLKARLDIYKKSSNEMLTWKLWTEMDAKSFIQFGENPNSQKGLFYAKLFTDIPFYNDSKGLEILLDFKRRDENFDPAIIILKSINNQQLFDDFMYGIEEERFNSIIRRIN